MYSQAPNWMHESVPLKKNHYLLYQTYKPDIITIKNLKYKIIQSLTASFRPDVIKTLN